MSNKWEEAHIRGFDHMQIKSLRYIFYTKHISFSIRCDMCDEWYLICNEIGFEWWKIGEPYKSDGSNIDEVKHIALRLVFNRIGTIYETLDIELERLQNDS